MDNTEQINHFLDLISYGNEQGGYSTDDALATILPLMDQALESHEAGLVAPLQGCDSLQISHSKLWYQLDHAISPSHNNGKINFISDADKGVAMEVIDRADTTTDLDENSFSSTNLRIWEEDTPAPVPVYVIGYETWEHRIGHHDALTDIFSLGLMLASLATGLNFYQADQLEQFSTERDTLHQHYDRIHPVILSTIVRMTELHRDRRVQDLRSVISVLKNYRDQSYTEEIDFSQQDGFLSSNDRDKRHIINSHLRDRLFDMSKRNKLIHFRTTTQTVNLTVSSVPLMLDYKNIKKESLFTWQPRIADWLAKEEAIPLDRYLRFEDAPYLPHSLDSLRREANRDKKEYGFSELRFVIAFFRWHNLKEDKSSRINSPLLLHPVELIKKKGVRDTWHLQPIGTQVDVNPALRYYLKQTYDLDLPEAIDLSETSVEDFYSLLKQQIQSSEPAVDLKMIDKPQIDLIKQRARKRLNTYLKRRKISGRSVRKYEDIDYSYSQRSFKPLGLQLFLNKVKPSELPLQYLLTEKPTLRSPGITSQEIEAKKETYHLREGSGENPYVWDFDLCSLTLANFSYKKMSLVRDYNTLLESDRTNPVFDEIFSLRPKEAFKQYAELKLNKQFLIVPADPTQTSSVAAARSGENLIIQGPPGTGKSQTITNLIADFVANEKRVLFVCEKRAALDVVYQRLAASDLEELTCIIHDSQTDKKAFIHDLKHTYEEFLKHDLDVDKIEKKIKSQLRIANKGLNALTKFGDAMTVNIAPENSDPFTVRNLLDRMIELKAHKPEIDDLELEAYPEYATWLQKGEAVRNINSILAELGKSEVFSESSFSKLKPQVYQEDSPVLALKQQVYDLKLKLEAINKQLTNFSFDTTTCTLQELRHLSFVADSIRYLASNNLLTLLDKKSPEYKILKTYQRQHKAQSTVLNKAQQKTVNWTNKLRPSDTTAALSISPALEKGIIRFFSPSFWKLRKVIKSSYNFNAHAVTPAWSHILSELQTEHNEEARLEELTEAAKASLGVDELKTLVENIEQFTARRSAAPIDNNDDEAFYQCLLLNDENSASTVSELSSMHDSLLSLDQLLEKFVRNSDTLEILDVVSLIDALDQELPILPELLKDLQELCNKDSQDTLYQMICEHGFSANQHEAACGMKSLAVIYREDRDLVKFEGWMLRNHTEKTLKNYNAWLNLNGERIVTKVGSHFRQLHAKASLSASQLKQEEKEFKKSFNAGRRELEHEFGKSMRYKSIRDLSTGDSGQVVLALKPIWLMSPLSISDAMPLEDNQFDVVIFDEASQIKLEEAIPAVQRAKQVIVVGDEMQLPPTNFFDTVNSDEEEYISFEEAGETFEYDLSSDSFLSHVGKTLPSKMLGWHYRSRYEALISFSNHSFYHGDLLTIPDRTLPQLNKEEIIITGENDFIPAPDSAQVLDRSISFHKLENGIYESRQNATEANYIALLVRELLNKDDSKTRKTIGIVAFSEAQQGRIETALSHLANDDSEFSRKLDVERDREDDGQHCGLFVKNLENVQGDERDIMILSICYAPDRNGKMRMNFGPINRSGGEKRLNVIFSRAKHHMAIISSIQSKQITNDYNDGANCLKRFLKYAEAVSIGDTILANHVLTQTSEKEDLTDNIDALTQSLESVLLEKGYLVERNVGESQFTCELAIRNPDDSLHKLAILTDSPAHYAISSSLERYVLRANILEAFGWQVIQVLAKDWYHDPDQVLLSIDRIMTG